jgi:hypothetical protein
MSFQLNQLPTSAATIKLKSHLICFPSCFWSCAPFWSVYNLCLLVRVARFFFVQHTKMGKIYPMASKYTKVPKDIPLFFQTRPSESYQIYTCIIVGPQGWNLSPRSEVIPQGWRPSVCPFVLLNISECSPLGWTKGWTTPPGNKVHTWGPSSPLGGKPHLDPGGQLMSFKTGVRPMHHAANNILMCLRRNYLRTKQKTLRIQRFFGSDGDERHWTASVAFEGEILISCPATERQHGSDLYTHTAKCKMSPWHEDGIFVNFFQSWNWGNRDVVPI